jgi:molybdopterin-guanine dinucleotide biosynthesis protein A
VLFGGYVLVGGKSSRFGRDKALLEVSGGPLFLRVAGAVRAAVGDAVLVGSPEKYGGLGVRVIPDAVAGVGPLGGILAALDDSTHKWNLITACDMPAIRADFLRFLLERATEYTGDLVLPLNRDGMPEPLCAVYHRQAAVTIRKSIEAGALKITRAFVGLKVLEIRAEEYAAFDPEGRLFANVNTVEEARAAGLVE